MPRRRHGQYANCDLSPIQDSPDDSSQSIKKVIALHSFLSSLVQVLNLLHVMAHHAVASVAHRQIIDLAVQDKSDKSEVFKVLLAGRLSTSLTIRGWVLLAEGSPVTRYPHPHAAACHVITTPSSLHCATACNSPAASYPDR